MHFRPSFPKRTMRSVLPRYSLFCSPSAKPAALAVAIQFACGGFVVLPAVWSSYASAETSVITNVESSPQTEEGSQQWDVNIPVAPLAEVLNSFAKASGIYLSGDATLTQGKNSLGLTGQYSVSEALSHLLEGTGIHFSIEGNTVTLIAAESEQSDVIMMDPVQVTGSASGNVIGTEGYYEKNVSSALKQPFPVMETPLSALVINEELIADQQSFRLDEVLKNDSSVQKDNDFLGAYSSYSIRGFSLSNSTNYLRDGRTFFHLSSPPTELLQKVEVLKGPSSVLYGTLAPGGLINLVSKAPPQETAGSIKVTAGSNELRHIHLDVGGPVNEAGTVRYRFNYISEDSQSFREFFDGSAFEVERDIYSLALAWDITEQTLLTLNYDNTSDDRPQDNGLIGSDGDVFDILPYDLIYNQPWTHYNSEVSNVLVELAHEFNSNWDIKVGYSFQDYERDRYDNQLRDFDPVTGDNVIRARRRLNQYDYTTYYADVMGVFDTASIRHNILIGYDRTKTDYHGREIEGFERVIFSSNIFGPAFPDPNIAIGNVVSTDNEDLQGYYLQDMLELGEQWRLLVGGRYDDFETSSDDGSGYEQSNFTPRAGLLYLLRDNLSLYASYSESFEPNGPVSGGFSNDGESLDPTVGEMFEIGAKWEALSGDLLISGAAFVIERDGNPIEDLVNNTIEQQGLQKHSGVELATTGLISENLSLFGSATYLDAKIKKDDDPLRVGNAPAGVPELSLSVWADYKVIQKLAHKLSLQGGVFYESDRPVDDQNSFDLDSYYRVDLGAKYAYKLSNGHSLITRLTVSNLFDEEYFKGRSAESINPQRPREIKTSLQYLF